jgi:hypothetical protein
MGVGCQRAGREPGVAPLELAHGGSHRRAGGHLGNVTGPDPVDWERRSNDCRSESCMATLILCDHA